MSKILKRNYNVKFHIKMSPDDMTLMVLGQFFENVSLRELDNSIQLLKDDLIKRDMIITMAEVIIEHAEPVVLTNKMFLSLKDIPEPVTSGVLKPQEE